MPAVGGRARIPAWSSRSVPRPRAEGFLKIKRSFHWMKALPKPRHEAGGCGDSSGWGSGCPRVRMSPGLSPMAVCPGNGRGWDGDRDQDGVEVGTGTKTEMVAGMRMGACLKRGWG